MPNELEQAMDANRIFLASEITFRVTRDYMVQVLCANCLQNALYRCLVDAVEFQFDYRTKCAVCANKVQP